MEGNTQIHIVEDSLCSSKSISENSVSESSVDENASLKTIDDTLLRRFEDLHIEELDYHDLNIEIECYRFQPDTDFLNFVFDCIKSVCVEITPTQSTFKYISTNYLNSRKLNFRNPKVIEKCKIFEENIRGYCHKDITQLKIENDQLKKYNGELVRRMKNTEICNSNLKKYVDDLIQEKEDEKRRASKAEDVLYERINDLTTILGEYQANCSVKDKVIEEINGKLQVCEDQLQFLTKENEDLQKQLQLEIDRVTITTTDLEESWETQANLRYEVHIAESYIKELKRSLTNLIEKNLSMTDKVQEHINRFNENCVQTCYKIIQRNEVLVLEDIKSQLQNKVVKKLLNQVQEIHTEAFNCQKYINKFQGSKKDGMYIRLTSVLNKAIFKLKNIDCHDTEIKRKRDEEILYVTRLIDKLNKNSCVI